MHGVYLPNPISWEKASHFRLDNGDEAIISYNQFHGEFVSCIQFPDGSFWQASDGLDNKYGTHADPSMREIFKDHRPCPDYAREWLDEHGLVRSGFKRVYPD